MTPKLRFKRCLGPNIYANRLLVLSKFVILSTMIPSGVSSPARTCSAVAHESRTARIQWCKRTLPPDRRQRVPLGRAVGNPNMERETFTPRYELINKAYGRLKPPVVASPD